MKTISKILSPYNYIELIYQNGPLSSLIVEPIRKPKEQLQKRTTSSHLFCLQCTCRMPNWACKRRSNRHSPSFHVRQVRKWTKKFERLIIEDFKQSRSTNTVILIPARARSERVRNSCRLRFSFVHRIYLIAYYMSIRSWPT